MQLLINGGWKTEYTIEKSFAGGAESEENSILNLDFTEKNYSPKTIFSQIETPKTDVCLSNFRITHSVFSHFP